MKVLFIVLIIVLLQGCNSDPIPCSKAATQIANMSHNYPHCKTTSN